MRIYLDLCCYNRPFDYTEWRQRLYNDMTLDELYDDVERFENITPNNGEPQVK